MLRYGKLSRGVVGLMLFSVVLLGGTPARGAESEVDRLLELLVKKKVLTQEEAASVRSEVKKGDAKVPGSDSTPAQAADSGNLEHGAKLPGNQPQTKTGLKERAQEAAAKLPFKISGYGQAQWSSLPERGSTFRLRRGHVSLDGSVGKLATYKIQIEALRSPSLLDAYLRLNLSPYAELTFGQFKVPFSQENLRSGSDLFTVERSQVVGNFVPGRNIGASGRDIGITLGGSRDFMKSAGVDYALAIVNGAGINHRDDNNSKDFVGRVALRTFPGLTVAGDYYHGVAGVTEVLRQRQEVEVTYVHRPLTVLGEYIWGADGAIRRGGWYGLGAWRFSKKWEGVFRVDTYDPNRLIPNETTTTYLGGVNWYFAPRLRWQFDYGLADKQHEAKSLFQSQIQFKF